MSSSDQAKSKLLDSMRMSKQGSTPETTAPATSKSAPAKKAKPASKAASTAAKTKSTKPAEAKKPITDNFQAAHRVWPD